MKYQPFAASLIEWIPTDIGFVQDYGFSPIMM